MKSNINATSYHVLVTTNKNLITAEEPRNNLTQLICC